MFQKFRHFRIKTTKGFTLAEVLVTLAIIGVVAALTIPSLIQTVQKQQYVSGFKEAYRTIAQATLMIKEENGGSMVGAFPTNSDMRSKYAEKLSVVKQCPEDGCDTGIVWRLLNGEVGAFSTMLNTTGGGDIGFYLTNGMILSFSLQSPSCGFYAWNYCGDIFIDVNGVKGPNQLGRDFFIISIDQNGASPGGTPDRSTYPFTNGVSCNPVETASCGAYCGNACGARIMGEGDMQY